MAAPNTAWGIDIGQCALKAIKLRKEESGDLMVDAFEVIEHSRVLSQSDVETNLLVQSTLEEFLQRADLTDSTVSVSVLGQGSFSRFVKLPPVERRKIPEIVRFEAEQQIPFPLDEVTWRYQTFQQEDSPEVEVGIFAMKSIDVNEMLAVFNNAGLGVDVVQMAPLALYNMMLYDGQIVPDGATLLADVGAEKTHLVVTGGPSPWVRTIQIGGNNFTEALVKSFKLSFPKAEKLKRTAASSKYARQIFQVMRPIFADLVQEIQRSIGFYTAMHRDIRFKRLLGTGNGFRLPGMQKYLEQNLNMPVERIDSFEHLSAPSGQFADNALSFGCSYGLAVQGLGDAPIQTNLLPEEIIRQRLWDKKRGWFVAAAAALLITLGLFVFRSYADYSKFKAPKAAENLRRAREMVTVMKQWDQEAGKIRGNLEKELSEIHQHLKYRAYTKTWPSINNAIAQAVYHTTKVRQQEQEVLREFKLADTQRRVQLAQNLQTDQAKFEALAMVPEVPGDAEVSRLRQRLTDGLKGKPRGLRELLVVEQMQSTYMPDLAAQTEVAISGNEKERRGFKIVLTCRMPTNQSEAVAAISAFRTRLQTSIDADPMLKMLGDLPQPRYLSRGVTLEDTSSGGLSATPAPGMGPIGPRPGMGGPGMAGQGGSDPLFPEESLGQDVQVELTMFVAVVDDGVDLPEEEGEQVAANRSGR